MTTGTITDIDAHKRQGYIRPDTETHGERIPFDLEKDPDTDLSPGDRVTYDVEGGLAGIMAINVRKQTS